MGRSKISRYEETASPEGLKETIKQKKTRLNYKIKAIEIEKRSVQSTDKIYREHKTTYI